MTNKTFFLESFISNLCKFITALSCSEEQPFIHFTNRSLQFSSSSEQTLSRIYNSKTFICSFLNNQFYYKYSSQSVVLFFKQFIELSVVAQLALIIFRHIVNCKGQVLSILRIRIDTKIKLFQIQVRDSISQIHQSEINVS